MMPTTIQAAKSNTLVNMILKEEQMYHTVQTSHLMQRRIIYIAVSK